MQPTQYTLFTAVLWGVSGFAGFYYIPRPDLWAISCGICFGAGLVGYFAGRDSR